MNRLFFTKSFCLRVCSTIACLILLAGVVFAANGKITGRVLDRETRESLPGANVVVTRTVLSEGVEVPLDRMLGASTDPDGYYFILNVPPGIYTLEARMMGYTPVTQKLVKVDLDRTITVNFELVPTSIQVEPVVVTANREIIKPDVSATQEVIGTTRLVQMPLLRVDEFIGRVKGVQLVSDAQGNGLSVRGGAVRETDVRLDGISLQDPRTENSYLALNSTSIQEIQVLTGGFEAKYGGIRSGLLNVVTKDGSRERYTMSIKADVAPSNQKKFFEDPYDPGGKYDVRTSNPWSSDSWIYRVYSGPYAMRGVKAGDSTVPAEFRTFAGWANRNTPDRFLDSTQKLDLWRLQHPQYSFADKPDYFIEGSITGPFPGSFIPLFGDFADKTTFLLGFKYENSQLAFPIGPRNNYLDWNTQLKLTTSLNENMRLSINGLYAKVETAGGGTTTSYGGALVDQASSFQFLSSTESSVARQASLLGGASESQMFNKSRLQFYDQRYVVGGAKLTHTLSDKTFYTLDFQVGFTDQQMQPFSLDTSRADAWVSFLSPVPNKGIVRFLTPDKGSPNASTNYGFDPLNTFTIYGGPQRVDSSHTYVYQLKGDITTQWGRHHQMEAGFSAHLQDLLVYTGTWFQSQLSYTPDTWQYYKATPLDIGLYIQDKLEFEGMVLNAGLRADYFNPMKKGYEVGFPQADYEYFFSQVYPTLPGVDASYQRWLALRNLLENPPGWPTTDTKVQMYLSPRLGVSFPVTESSKLYFNYGHFYQRPPVSFLYNLQLNLGSTALPSPGLSMARTVSYEFGYEQMLFAEFLVNVTAYYKDVTGDPLSRSFINYYGDNIVSQYFPDGYEDIRGVEIRLERPVGKYVTFNAMYDYMSKSTGQSGLATVFENRLLAKDNETRSPNLVVAQPRPRANASVNFLTPEQFGPEVMGVNWLGGLVASFLFEWRSGGQVLLNPEEPDIKLRNYVDMVDTWNIDFRGSKLFRTAYGSIELVVTIQNLTNNRWLNTDNMLQTQFSDYKNSLKTPNKGGNDKWGQYESDDNHIKIGWWQAPIFLNPRRVIAGLRMNF